VTFYSNYWAINTDDANPAGVIYEVLVNDAWGMGLDPASIDFNSFNAVPQILFNEGFGYSAQWDSPRAVQEVVEEVLKYLDGVLYTDLETGLLTRRVARKDYDENNLLTFNEDNVIEMTGYSRGAWDETTNEVTVTYTDRTKSGANYKFKEKRRWLRIWRTPEFKAPSFRRNSLITAARPPPPRRNWHIEICER
jgi:hypothetical protein